MGVLTGIEPQNVFRFFEEICNIPHGSFHTEEISNYLVQFAKDRDLSYRQDEFGNVIIRKDGTPGYEDATTVILQGHMDMVCQQEDDCTKDMEKEGLDLAIDGDFIYAEGTTLGGDDGVAVAFGLAILDANDLEHPPLELVLTVDEEVGLIGATKLDASDLKGRRLINLDSEEEGILTVSCAGGNDTFIDLPIEREAQPKEKRCRIRISGLTGGHSGMEIIKGRANAAVLMGRTLSNVARECEFSLVSVNGGRKVNAIMTDCEAIVETADPEALARAVDEAAKLFVAEYRATDPEIDFSAEEVDCDKPAMTGEATKKVITMLVCAPNGIYAMSPDIEGLVQTSLNLGILKTEEDDRVTAAFGVRSSIDSQKAMLVDKICRLADQLGASVDISGDYPGWAYREDSPLRDVMVRVFTEQYGHEPKVEAVHAGLECGILGGKIDDLDSISIGPDVFDVHTPNEKLSISSVERSYRYLLEVLRQLKD